MSFFGNKTLSSSLIAASVLLSCSPADVRESIKATEAVLDEILDVVPHVNQDEHQEVIGMLQLVMDKPRTVPAAGPRKAEVRGGAGEFAKLSKQQADEVASAVIYVADKFLPKSLTPSQRRAIVVAQGSAETAFRWESMVPKDRPANDCACGPYHCIPGIWAKMFKERAVMPGLVHYDGKPWLPKDTSAESVRDSVWDASVLAYWEISEQAKAGGANPRAAEFHEDGPGPMPKTIRSGFLCHLLGYGEARKGKGSPGYEAQWPWYESSLKTDLNLLGFDISLLDASY